MKPNKFPIKTRRYFLTSKLVQIFLFAMASDTESNSQEKVKLIIEEIRKKNLKILIIDDDDKFRKSLCFKLKRVFNIQLEDVNSGKLGVERITKENHYDMIFTDIMMPEMTGIETYYELRKIDPKIKIVVMSAYSSSEEWKKAQELKDITLLHKPFSDDELIRVLINNDTED